MKEPHSTSPRRAPDHPASACSSPADGSASPGAARQISCDDARDRDLIRRIAQGDREAFAELYDAVAARLHGLIRGIVGDGTAADDVLQEAMLIAWQKAPSFDARAARPIVWLMLIARGKAIDHLRRRKAHASAVDRLADRVSQILAEAPGAEDDPASEAGVLGRARRAVAALPPEQRETILMAFQGGMSGPEIARHHGVPLGTVKTRIRLGMLRLRESFASLREIPA